MKNFSTKTYDFLYKNRLNNSRDWYLAHKNDYIKYVSEPLQTLVNALAPVLKAIDGDIVIDTGGNGNISRIYRDLRFSKDKMLYRDEMWLSFKRDKKAFTVYPEFYFMIEPNGFSWGCGYYAASSATMDAMRMLILSDSEYYINADRVLRLSECFTLAGESFKRSRFPMEAAEKRMWLDRRNISMIHSSVDYKLLFSDRLADVIKADYKQLTPVYKLFLEARIASERT